MAERIYPFLLMNGKHRVLVRSQAVAPPDEWLIINYYKVELITTVENHGTKIISLIIELVVA